MIENVQGKKLSPGKRVAGLAGIAASAILGIGVGLGIGLWGMRGFALEAPPPGSAIGSPFLMALVLSVLGGLAFAIALGGYFLSLSTLCFTFDFSRPVFAAFKKRLWVAFVFVSLFLVLGGALWVTAVLAPMLSAAGMSAPVSIFAPLIGTFLLMQSFLIWFQIWAPLDKKLITRRLAACGLSPRQMASGVCVGISDPAKSSFKKMTLVEDDCGMLWFAPEALIYRGDTDHFDVTRHQLVEVERQADAGGISAYAGAVHVILRFRRQDGCERRVRLHTAGFWTLTAAAKAMDRLAQQIAAWREDAAAPAASQTPRGA